jgi:cytochrome c5
MSDVNPQHEDDGPHEGPIKTPKQLVLAVIFAFVVPIVAIVLLVSFVAADKRPAAGSDALGPLATAQRIQPVGTVAVRDAAAESGARTGEQAYAAACVACHGAGTLGAPKLGDATAWGPRLTQGFEALVASALKGKGAMPPQGGGPLSEVEVARAVAYMANQAGGKFEEPAAPAPAGTANAAAPTTPAEPAPATAAAPASTAPAAAPAATTQAPATPPAAEAAAAAGPPDLYTQSCGVCHNTGVANAPKMGDKGAWAPRVAQGLDALTASVIKGKGAMPPKGGSNASEEQIRTVVQYMVEQAK